MIRAALPELANVLRDERAINGSRCYIDAAFASTYGAGDEIGRRRRGKRVTIMVIADRHGLPLAVTTHAANHNHVILVQLTFDFCMIEAKRESPIGGKAYDTDPLDAQFPEHGAELIAPHKSNRTKRKTQNGCRLPRYERRWIIERFFFAWIQWQRWLLVRWEYCPTNFLDFVQLPALCILLRQY